MKSKLSIIWNHCVAIMVIVSIYLVVRFLSYLADLCFPDGYPVYLAVLDFDNLTDLLVGVFTAQVALVASIVTFLGLLTQFFQSQDCYLGVTLREVVFSNSFLGMTLFPMMASAFYSSLLSYYFVAQQNIVGLLTMFVFCIIIVVYIIQTYVRIVTGSIDVKGAIIERFLIAVDDEIKKENIFLRGLLK